MKSLNKNLLLYTLLFFHVSTALAEIPPSESSKCVENKTHDSLEWWHLPNGQRILRYKKPTLKAIEEWRSSKISQDMIEANLVSLPDMACSPEGGGKIYYPIIEILGCNPEIPKFHYQTSWEREAWTYLGHDTNTLKDKSKFELKPLPKLRVRKYEFNQERHVSLLKIPQKVAEAILNRKIKPNRYSSSNFWSEIKSSGQSIILTEGTKKAAALLSHNLTSVSIPGACHGARYVKLDSGDYKLQLTEDLLPLLNHKRLFYISYDIDTHKLLNKVTNSNAYYLGKLLEERGMDVKIVELPGPEKAVDDFLMTHGVADYRRLLDQAQSLDEFAKTHLILSVNEMAKQPWCARVSDAFCPIPQ